MIKEIQDRIHANKLSKGFPIGDINYDITKIQEEIQEFITADLNNDNENRSEELADIIILTIGMASYFDIDIQSAILQKLQKIEKRKIIRLDHNQFTKEEA